MTLFGCSGRILHISYVIACITRYTERDETVMSSAWPWGIAARPTPSTDYPPAKSTAASTSSTATSVSTCDPWTDYQSIRVVHELDTYLSTMSHYSTCLYRTNTSITCFILLKNHYRYFYVFVVTVVYRFSISCKIWWKPVATWTCSLT